MLYVRSNEADHQASKGSSGAAQVDGLEINQSSLDPVLVFRIKTDSAAPNPVAELEL